MIQGICGRTFIGSSVPDGPLSSWESRLRERLATVGSTECALIWRVKTTPAGASISRLAVSTRHTNGTGSTGSQWRSPTAGDKRGGAYADPEKAIARINGPHTVNLEDQIVANAKASPWVTPSARDWKDTPGMATETGDRSRIDQLPRQMAVNAAMWPTAVANPDNKTPEAHLAMKQRMGERDGSGANRTAITDITVMMKAVAYMPTPTVADVQGGRKTRSGARSNEPLLNGQCFEMEPTGPTPNGSPATTEKRGAPNPVFAFWLMGFPDVWISGALEAMRSFRKPRRKSSPR